MEGAHKALIYILWVKRYQVGWTLSGQPTVSVIILWPGEKLKFLPNPCPFFGGVYGTGKDTKLWFRYSNKVQGIMVQIFK